MTRDIDQIRNEILNKYINGNDTQKEIASRLGIKQNTVSYHYNKLVKEMGLSKKGGVPTQYRRLSRSKDNKKNKEWSYHALEFEVVSYYESDKFKKFLKKAEGTTEVIGEWRVCFYRHKLIIWLKAGQEFTSPDKEECIIQANESLLGLMEYIRFRYGFYVVKNKKSSIRLLKHHLSYRNAPEHDIITEGHMFVQFKQNGQVVMQYDRSKGFKEREYPSQAVYHSDKIEPYIMDFLNQPLTNSQITSRINDIVTTLEKMTKVIDMLIQK